MRDESAILEGTVKHRFQNVMINFMLNHKIATAILEKVGMI